MTTRLMTRGARGRRFRPRVATGAVAVAAAVSLTGLLPAHTALAAPSDLVTVPDANFKACINDALGQAATSDITEGQAAGLTELDCDNRSVASLAGAQYLTGLVSLKMFNNSISDLSPVAGLTALEHLSVNSNDVEDIAVLAGLTTLTWLDLSSNDIADVGHLSGLTGLEYLSVLGNEVADITPLSNMTSLKTLRLQNNAIEDIAPLPVAPSLSTLNLRGNQIVDVAPLAQMDSLISLRLGGNAIEDIAPLSGLTSLSYLHLQGNSIYDVAALATMTNDFIKLELDGQSYDLGTLEIDASVPNPVRDLHGGAVALTDPRDNGDGTFTPTGSPGQASPLPWSTALTVGQTDGVEFSGELTFEQVDAPEATASPEITSIGPEAQFTVCDAPTSVSGTGEPGAEVEVALVDLTESHAGTGQEVILEEFSPQVDAEGNWTVDFADPLSMGDYAVGVREPSDEVSAHSVSFTVAGATCDSDSSSDGDSSSEDSDSSLDGGSSSENASDDETTDPGNPSGSISPADGTGSDSTPDRLPETGVDVSTSVAVSAAALLLVAGAALVAIRRRRTQLVTHSRDER